MIERFMREAGNLVNALMKITGLSLDAIKKLLEFLTTLLDTPIDDILKKICGRLGLCNS